MNKVIFDLALAHSPQGIVVLNVELKAEFINIAASRLLGVEGFDIKNIYLPSLPLIVTDEQGNHSVFEKANMWNFISQPEENHYQGILKISANSAENKNWVRITIEKTNQPLLYFIYLNDANAEIENKGIYDTLFSKSPFTMVINDYLSGKYIDVNDRFCIETGDSPEECIGKTSVEMGYIPSDDNDKMINEVLIKHNKIEELEFRYADKVHSDRTALIWTNPFTHNQNHLVSTLIDITEKKKVEKNLIESEAKFRGLYEQMMDAYIWSDNEGNIKEFNQSLVRMTGYTCDELSKISYTELVIESGQPEQGSNPCIRKNEIFEAFIRHKKGHLIPVEYRAVNNKSNFGAKSSGRWSIIRDITRRVEAFKKLSESKEDLRALAAHLQEIREQERARISREIHDDLGYILTTIKLGIESYLKQHTDKSESNSGDLAFLPDLIDTGIDSVRRIATELRPGILDHFGLIPALEWLIQQFRLRTSLAFNTSFPETPPEFNKNQTIAVFRIFQEALTNIVRHAEATLVSFEVIQRNNKIAFSIDDNGKGFDVDGINYRTSLGLLGMKEWARSIDAGFSIKSNKNNTRIKLVLPVK